MMSFQAVGEMCKMFGTHRRLVVLAVLLAACYFHITGASKRSRPPPKPLVFFPGRKAASSVDAKWGQWGTWAPDCTSEEIRQSRVRECEPGRFGGLKGCCNTGKENWITRLWFKHCPAHEIRTCVIEPNGKMKAGAKQPSTEEPPKEQKGKVATKLGAALQVEEENEQIKRDNEKEDDDDNTTLIVAVVAVVGVVAVVAGVAVFVIKKKKSAAGAAAGGAPPPQGPGAGANDGRMDVEGGQGSQGGSRRSSRSSQGRGSQGSGRSSRSSSSGSRGSQKSRGSKVDSKRSGSQY